MASREEPLDVNFDGGETEAVEVSKISEFVENLLRAPGWIFGSDAADEVAEGLRDSRLPDLSGIPSPEGTKERFIPA
jgi:hypothetical protein